MDILLYNNKNEVVSLYTQNNLNYKKNSIIDINGESKKYKVTNIEKYRKLDVSESVEQVTLELMQTS
jgi:hypothetical protein